MKILKLAEFVMLLCIPSVLLKLIWSNVDHCYNLFFFKFINGEVKSNICLYNQSVSAFVDYKLQRFIDGCKQTIKNKSTK